MKKKLLSSIIIAFVLVNCFAQAPQGIPYQGLARSANETVISNQSISVRFTILNGSHNGTVVYIETHTTTTDSNGLFSVVIGLGTAQNGTVFNNIDWSNGSKFLKDEIDTGSGYILLGTTQMMSVPYALYSATSGTVSANSTIIPFSYNAIFLSKQLNSNPRVTLVGFGSGTNLQVLGGGQLDLKNQTYAFVTPVDGSISTIAASLTVGIVDPIPVSNILAIAVRLYQAPVSSNVFTPIPGAVVYLSPNLSGNVPDDTIFSGITSGMNIPVTAQTKLLLVYTVAITGPDVAYRIDGHGSAGVLISH